VFIAAAIAEGFIVERANNGPNAWLNISSRANNTIFRGDGARMIVDGRRRPQWLAPQ
jgi:hypothetical protein